MIERQFVPIFVRWIVEGQSKNRAGSSPLMRNARITQWRRCVEVVGAFDGIVAASLRQIGQNGPTLFVLDAVVSFSAIGPNRLRHRRANNDRIIAVQCIDNDRLEVSFGWEQTG